ncbi:MAG TPA: SRPBCC family protein, partial [Isoptericola sp.]|nr:SRPBCC family protein [Isoptericola sp.]
ARRDPASALGRLVVVDRMVVEQLERPSTAAARVGRTRLRKLGPVLLGEAGFDVVPMDAGRCRVVWWEEAYLAGPLPRAVTAPLVGLALRVFMRLSLGRLARALDRRR